MSRPHSAIGSKFSAPKLNRRLTVSRRCILDLWVLIEVDSVIVSLSENPGAV
jgi:hypothetical protein